MSPLTGKYPARRGRPQSSFWREPSLFEVAAVLQGNAANDGVGTVGNKVDMLGKRVLVQRALEM